MRKSGAFMLVLLQAIFLVALVGCGHRADIEKAFDAGLAAFDRGHYDVALLDLEPRAHAGDREAQFRVGEIYRKDNNVDLARKFLAMAGNQSHFGAQSRLGEMSLQSRNYAEAEKWYREAMQKQEGEGDVAVAFGLGQALEHQGKLEDAKKYFEKVVALGSGPHEAEYRLAIIYLGEYKKSDEKALLLEGLEHLKTAADKGHIEAGVSLAMIYADDLDEKIICSDQKICINEAKKYLKKASDHPGANFVYYQILSRHGDESTATRQQAEWRLSEAIRLAEFWLSEAAKSGDPDEYLQARFYSQVEEFEEILHVALYSQVVESLEEFKSYQESGLSGLIRSKREEFLEFTDMMETLIRLSQHDEQSKYVIEARNVIGMVTQHTEDYVDAYHWYKLADMDVPEDMRMQMDKGDVRRAEELVAQWKPKEMKGTGSGFHIGEGYLLTNRHVVNGCEDVRVSKFRRARIVKLGTERGWTEDLALLKMELMQAERSSVKPPIIRPTPVAQTEKAYLFGYPLAGRLPGRGNFTVGWVSSYHPDGLFVHTADNHSGNSGGPVLDESGSVIGVNAGKWLDVDLREVWEGSRKRTRELNTAQRANIGLGYSNILKFLGSPEDIQPEEEETYEEFRRFMYSKLSNDIEHIFDEGPSPVKNIFMASRDMFKNEFGSAFDEWWELYKQLIDNDLYRKTRTPSPKQTPEEIHKQAEEYTVQITCWQDV